jgi:DNA (cytosine-5)-methyltransferase 1
MGKSDFSTAIKYEFHGPNGQGDLDAITEVAWRKRFRIVDLFAGIGGVRLGFEAVGGRSVFSSEWDTDAQTTYEANFGDRPAGDITAIPPDEIPDHDVLLAGFPCQAFSIIGNRLGFSDTRGTLFFNVEEILRAKRPAAVLLENVKQLKTHDHGRTFRTIIDSLTTLGYFTHTAILNALNYGVCQKRERTFIVAMRADLDFEFPAPVAKRRELAEILEPDSAIDESLWASDHIRRKRLARLAEQGKEPFYPSIWHENKGGHIGIFPYSCALRANASYNYMLVNGNRRPTGREMLRIQGYPDSFKIPVGHSAIRKQCGNSVAVPVIKAIAEQMVRALSDAAPRRIQQRQATLPLVVE